MHMGAEDGDEDDKEEEGYMGIHVTMLQGKGLSRDRAYLDNCSTVTAFSDP